MGGPRSRKTCVCVGVGGGGGVDGQRKDIEGTRNKHSIARFHSKSLAPVRWIIERMMEALTQNVRCDREGYEGHTFNCRRQSHCVYCVVLDKRVTDGYLYFIATIIQALL